MGRRPIPEHEKQAIAAEIKLLLQQRGPNNERLCTTTSLGAVCGGLSPEAIRKAREPAGVGPAVRGDALLHLDVRPDNLLLEPGGTMRVVDWNQAVLGAPWVDLVSLWPLMHHHGIDLARFDGSPLLAGVPDERVDALLAFFVGFMLYGIDDPPPPGCTPALRAHALFFAETTLRLMAARRGWSLEP